MKYDTIRDSIKSGDILLWSKGRGFIANIIRIFTKSEYTHVGIAYVIANRIFVIDAWPGNGIRLHLLSSLTPFFIIKSNSWTKEMEDFALSKIGEVYSYVDAILGYFGMAKKDSAWECAEFVQAVYAHTFPEINKLNPTPANIARFFIDRIGSITKVNK